MLHRLLTALKDTEAKARSQNAQALLTHAISRAARAHRVARVALATVMAEEAREAERCADLDARADDLQGRAIAAIRGGREDLAAQAADAIAALEIEIAATKAASARFAARAAGRRADVEAQRRRLADLDRGRRLAQVGAALVPPLDGHDPFADAEASLARIEADQADAAAVQAELAPIGANLVATLAACGFGQPLLTGASDVMARLRTLAASEAAPQSLLSNETL